MLILVILLVFSFELVSSVTQTVRFDIEVIHGVTSCTSQRVDLMEGDDVNIETKVPSRVVFMWCQNQLGYKPITRGGYEPNNHKFYANATNLNNTSLYSPWTCEYLMERDPSILSHTFRQGTTYNYAQCILKINVLETFRYSGLESSRLTTRTRADQTDYFYTYNIGEHLSIGCEHDARRNITFKFHDSTTPIDDYTTITKSRFEVLATRNLSSSNLLCYYMDGTYGQIYSIKLYLQARTLMYSGLDPARLRISSNGDHHYSYRPGEFLTIGCETSGSEAKTFQFCNSTSRECNIIQSHRKFELQATIELNYSYLLCNIAGDHICLYLDNHEVPQTLSRDTSAPVVTQQPDTQSGRSAQATTTAVSSAVSRHERPRSDADKIWFTGFTSALIVTETHLAATYYVYKYKNKEDLNVNCSADPGDGTIIFQFGYKNYPLESMETFVYRATADTNESILLCVLQQNNGMNVYTKRVTLLLDTEERPTTTPATVQTTTITSREPRGINRNPAAKPNTTHKPQRHTTKRANPVRKPVTTKRPNPVRKPVTTKRPNPARKPVTTRRPVTTKAPKATTTTIKPSTRITSNTVNKPMNNTALQNVNSANSTAVVEITGTGLILVSGKITFKKEYRYNYKEEHEIDLTCTVSGVIGDFEIILENDQNVGARKPFFFKRNSGVQRSVSHPFKLTPESKTISCIAKDVQTNSTRFKSTVYLNYEADPTTAPSTFNPDTANSPTPPVEPTRSTELQEEKFPWKFVAIGVAVFVTLFVVIASLAMLCRQKKPQPTDSDYANLTNDSQNDYLTMPVPEPAPRKSVPTVEGTYSEPKDSNDMSEALYADPNVFRAVKSEETYAEPYNANSELYTTPIPKAQRGKKLKDDPNYSNVFGKDYVNSKPK